MKDQSDNNRLSPLADIQPGSPHNSARETANYDVAADALWRTWLDVASRMPRTRLVARDDTNRRSFHIQRSRLFRFPDLVRAEVSETGQGRSRIGIDSRARYGHSDLGVNRRRVDRWLAALTTATG